MRSDQRPAFLHSIVPALVYACTLLMPGRLDAQQAMPAWGRLSVYFNMGGASERPKDGEPAREGVRYDEIITSFTWRSQEPHDGGAEFAFDGRSAAYPGMERESRMSVYDGYVGYRAAQGQLGVRAGQMWINDLGGLGAVAGVLVEARRKPSGNGTGTLRIGAFGGLEPSPLDIEYASGVRKAGGYVAFDGQGARRHVVGFVQVRNNSLTERSVVTTTNFLPLGRRLFLYQAGEYDLAGIGGTGGARLSYWITNARITPASRVDLQVNYHRGRSVDTRSLALAILQGAPVSSQRVQGLLFESVGGRVRVTVVPRVRVAAGYSRDRTNSQDAHNDRYQFGAHAWNVAGLDLNLTRSSISGNRTYTAWDASVGRTLGSRLYVTGEYSTDLSSIRFVDQAGGFTIEHRPRSRRVGGSALANLTRRYSILFSADHTDDGEVSEHREMAGLSLRF